MYLLFPHLCICIVQLTEESSATGVQPYASFEPNGAAVQVGVHIDNGSGQQSNF